jgi:cytochrome P450
MIPPKPTPRPDQVSLLRYARLFREDILSAQPERLYRAWMAEFRTPFFRSFLLNQPELVRTVLQERPGDFPKSDRIGEGLRPLLGNSVFLSTGATWRRQRRIIDPAFEGGRLRDTFPAMQAAAEAALRRLQAVGSAPIRAIQRSAKRYCKSACCLNLCRQRHGRR